MMSDAAIKVLDLIGSGMVLFLPSETGLPMLLNRVPYKYGDPMPVAKEIFIELIYSGKLHHLWANTFNDKPGWEEMGLPGYRGDLWCCIQ